MPVETPDADDLVSRMRPILCAQEPIAAAWLFGSAARGELREGSDVDVGLLLRRAGETAIDHYELIAQLAARLESITTPFAVDVVVLEPQGPVFCHRALVEGILICEPDRERRIAFESETVVRALDFLPTYERARAGLRDGIRRRLRQLK